MWNNLMSIICDKMTIEMDLHRWYGIWIILDFSWTLLTSSLTIKSPLISFADDGGVTLSIALGRGVLLTGMPGPNAQAFYQGYVAASEIDSNYVPLLSSLANGFYFPNLANNLEGTRGLLDALQ